ncbi:hypothetical protein H7698_25895 [Pseudomonas sp. p50]|uniref:hypothetical protein n=1 Tax=Pseudomonas sp. p50(2008) TaxID=2816832 RepID=UPI00188C95A3|nr:hypothetical protein [Pseudomonas sp. p50(2008)]MBF4559509.1 hypothetical protein [Pseudomonas sp. p50(2008)]
MKLDETLRSHSPSMNGHLQKRLGDRLRKVFTGIHSMRSLPSAARPVLAVLRHIRSSVCSLVVEHRLTLAAGGQFWTIYEHTNGMAAPEMTDGNDNAFRIEGFLSTFAFSAKPLDMCTPKN